MSKELIVPISSIEFDAPYFGTALQSAFVKAGVRIKPTVDVYAFPKLLPPYEMHYCPKHDAYIVRQP